MSNYPLDDVQRAILALLPDAEIGHDNDGQLVVYTGLTLETDDVASGEVIFPEVIPPTPEGAIRLVVLNDGETFTDANGVCVLDWFGENEIEDIEQAIEFGSLDLHTVAWFDETGVAR